MHHAVVSSTCFATMMLPVSESFFELQCINFCRMEWIMGAIIVFGGMLKPIWKPKYLVLAP